MPPAKTKERNAAKKAKQEKILLAVLGVLFVVIFFFFVLPKITKKPVARASVPLSTTTTAGTPGAVGTPSATPAPVATGGSSSFSAPSAVYTGDTSHIGRFSKLDSKDPFAGHVTAKVVAPKSATPPAIPPRTVPIPKGQKTKTTSATPTSTDASIPLYATLSVNGVQEVVTVGGQFPAAAPLFVLKAAGPTWITFGLVDGTFATNAPTATLRVGRKLTLTNTADHSQFVLQLLKVSQQAPVAPTSTTPTQTDTGVLEAPQTTPASPGSGSTPPPPTAPTGG